MKPPTKNYIFSKIIFHKRGIKVFSGKQKLGEFIASRPVLQEMIKGSASGRNKKMETNVITYSLH